MQRFHRAMSLTLLVLASVILVTELFRAPGQLSRLVVIVLLALFFFIVIRIRTELFEATNGR
jgi:hypothetical protein